MNKEQIIEWIKSAKFVEYASEDIDGCGNNWIERVYEKDGKFFIIPYLDKDPVEKYDYKKNIYIRGEYEIEEVKAVQKTVVVTEYIRKGK